MQNSILKKTLLSVIFSVFLCAITFSCFSYTIFNYTFKPEKAKNKKFAYEEAKTPFGVNVRKVLDTYGTSLDNATYNDVISITYHNGAEKSWFMSYGFINENKDTNYKDTRLVVTTWGDKMFNAPSDAIKDFNKKYAENVKKYGQPYIFNYIDSKEKVSAATQEQAVPNAANEKLLKNGAQLIAYWLDGTNVHVINTRQAFEGKFCAAISIQSSSFLPSKDKDVALKNVFESVTTKFSAPYGKVNFGMDYYALQNAIGPATSSFALPESKDLKALRYDISKEEMLIFTFKANKLLDISARKTTTGNVAQAAKILKKKHDETSKILGTPIEIASFKTGKKDLRTFSPITEKNISEVYKKDNSFIIVFKNKAKTQRTVVSAQQVDNSVHLTVMVEAAEQAK